MEHFEFQSSPVHQDGRNRETYGQGKQPWLVSILARPSGRAQPWRPGAPACPPFGFNPRPSIRTGATPEKWLTQRSRSSRFNPRPSIRTGATPARYGLANPIGEFQSSPVHQDGRNLVDGQHRLRALYVSILARPSGRAQLAVNKAVDPVPAVSILARPSGRAQHAITLLAGPRKSGFNPRPSIRTGATAEKVIAVHANQWFQSSPVHQDGRNSVTRSRIGVANRFQSSPVHQDGRNSVTRSRIGVANRFQSSPVHQDGRNSRRTRPRSPSESCFNPRPSIRTGATSQPSLRAGTTRLFQSSPVHQDGRNTRKEDTKR